MKDKVLVTAATSFAAVTAYGAVVSVLHDVDGEPLRVRVAGTVPMHLATGCGSGLSAPWPMPAVALAAAVVAHREPRRAGRTIAAIGALLCCGTLVEPVTWGRRSRHPAVLSTIPLNLAAGVVLVLVGRRAALGATD